MSHLPKNTDVVSLSALQLATTVGPDHWHRNRPQPIALSLHLYLSPSYLDAPGQSDSVADSLHYGHLAKAVEKRVGAKGERSYASARALLNEVTDAVFTFAMDASRKGADEDGVVHAVRAVLALPKQVLLAGRFEVELTASASDWQSRSTRAPGAIVRVIDLTLPVLIGVNAPERLAKQRVVIDLTFFEAARSIKDGSQAIVSDIDYPAIVQQMATNIENSAFLTLEKLVYEIIKMAYQASDAYADVSGSRIDAITVRCQKPSALSFADTSGVEMTRTQEALQLAVT